MKSAGARKNAPTRYRPSLPGSPVGGGAATTGGSAVIPPALMSLLLVRRRCCGLELFLDPADVLGVLQERLEEAPLARARRGAERRRLVVGHVEHHRLGRE